MYGNSECCKHCAINDPYNKEFFESEIKTTTTTPTEPYRKFEIDRGI